MEVEDIKTMKIRIYPNKEQRTLFKQCISASRHYYNKSIEEINKRYSEKKKMFEESKTCIKCENSKEDKSYLCKAHSKSKIKWDLNINFQNIRNCVVPNDKIIKENKINEWHSLVPLDTRQIIVNDAITAYKTSTTNLKRKNIEHFSLGFKKYDKNNGIFWTTKNAVKIDKNKNVSIFVRRLKENKFLKMSYKNKVKLPNANNYQSKILLKKGAWYLILSLENIEEKCKFTNKRFIVSLDPGIRTFQSGYDLNGYVMDFGKNDIKKIKEKHIKIDFFKSIIDKIKSKGFSEKVYSLKKKIMKLERKVNGIVNNLHKQVSCFLVNNYENILLPHFETSKMQKSKTLPSSVKRMMNSLSFYKFSEWLKYKCSKQKSNLFRVEEHYTSKLCGGCGILNNVGTSKIYKCKCGVVLDRDYNGARNILIQYIN